MARPTTHEELIRAARARSNRGIAERKLLLIAESLDTDFLVVVGDGTLIPSRKAYLEAFDADFANPETALRYERIADTVCVSHSHPLASEQGHWIGYAPDGSVAYTGTYAAMWRRGASGWKLRSEIFITLTGVAQHEPRPERRA